MLYVLVILQVIKHEVYGDKLQLVKHEVYGDKLVPLWAATRNRELAVWREQGTMPASKGVTLYRV